MTEYTIYTRYAQIKTYLWYQTVCIEYVQIEDGHVCKCVCINPATLTFKAQQVGAVGGVGLGSIYNLYIYVFGTYPPPPSHVYSVIADIYVGTVGEVALIVCTPHICMYQCDENTGSQSYCMRRGNPGL